MSEYQYYEFAATDRPLTRTDMAELRTVSIRAAITPSGFANHYEWGDLKADPADWMRRYFDVFVYTANWCSCRLDLRVPLSNFRKAELKPFATKYALTIEASDEHWIFDWALDESEDYDRFAEEDGHGWMQRLAPLRELAKTASGVRLEREAKEYAKLEAERRSQREAHLRRLMADVDKHWEAINAQARRGSASGYDQAVRALAELAEGYALMSSYKEFKRALRRFVVRHATRGALLRRLTEAGLWSG